MAWPYRCTREDCRRRVTLAKRLEEYKRDKPCPGCSRDSLKLDGWRLKGEGKRYRCNCDGWWFPHRKGSLGCNHGDGQWKRVWSDLGCSRANESELMG